MKRDLEECGNPEGDGCVVNYGGGREYWCQYADQDSVKEDEECVKVYCVRLKRKVIAVQMAGGRE